MTITSSRLKRKIEPDPASAPLIRKKLRSKLPRRRRFEIRAIQLPSTSFNFSVENHGLSVASVDSSSCLYSGGEVSCNTSRASVEFESNGGFNLRRESVGEIEGVRMGECVDFLRDRRFEKQNESEVEVAESSCVESSSVVDIGVPAPRSLILKFRSGKERKNLKGTEGNEASKTCTKSEITSSEKQCSGENSKSCARNLKNSSDIKENDSISISRGAREKFENFREEAIRGIENRTSEFELSEVSRIHNADVNCDDLNAQSTLKQVETDLACTERFSYEDFSEYSSSQDAAFSDLHSEIFPDCSELELSDYTPSLFMDSGSQFSEGSVGETPSPTYSLFLQYSNEFSRLPSPLDNEIHSSDDNEGSYQPEYVRFEDVEDEDSYQMLRKRERRQLFLCNYAEKYCSTTKYGKLVLQQRSRMVHWIVQHSCGKELRQETTYLAVSLFDRFLSKGYFKAKKNLQIAGIACLTLATRIEENQPHNSVRQKNFYIENSVYSRREVVAMEWMVQEVLNFQCILPTINHFLWFYLKAARADAEMEKRVRYLAALALSDHEQLCYWPSTVAAALVILACLEDNQDTSQKVIGIHVRSKDENLHKCMESLEWLLCYL